MTTREKRIHRAAFVNEKGQVSPLCASTPRALNLSRETWTVRDEAVTCAKCLEQVQRLASLRREEIGRRA